MGVSRNDPTGRTQTQTIATPYLFITPYGLFLTPNPFKYPPCFIFDLRAIWVLGYG